MEMKPLNSGKLRGMGYDARKRTLLVKLEDGSLLEYAGISEAQWLRFSSSGAAWSFYRDNIEDEFTGRRVSGKAEVTPNKNPLDDLFG